MQFQKFQISNCIPATRGNFSIDNQQGYIFPIFLRRQLLQFAVDEEHFQFISSPWPVHGPLGLHQVLPPVFVLLHPQGNHIIMHLNNFLLKDHSYPALVTNVADYTDTSGLQMDFQPTEVYIASNTLHRIPGPSLGHGPSPGIFLPEKC